MPRACVPADLRGQGTGLLPSPEASRWQVKSEKQNNRFLAGDVRSAPGKEKQPCPLVGQPAEQEGLVGLFHV